MNHESGHLSAASALTDPHARLAVALVLSLALWAPFGAAALRSDLDVTAAALRYLVAFVGCRVAVGGIAHLVASYHAMHAMHAVPAPATEAPSAPGPTTIGRRADDPAA